MPETCNEGTQAPVARVDKGGSQGIQASQSVLRQRMPAALPKPIGGSEMSRHPSYLSASPNHERRHMAPGRSSGETIHCKIVNRHVPLTEAAEQHIEGSAACWGCGDQGNKCLRKLGQQ